MKKFIALVLSVVLVLSLAACGGGSASPLDSIKGATTEQKQGIQKVLDDNGIKVKSCVEGKVEETEDENTNALTKVLSASITPYDIADENGKTYRMTIKKEDMSVMAIVDTSDGSFVYGGVAGLLAK